jgi:hypothetical protein
LVPAGDVHLQVYSFTNEDEEEKRFNSRVMRAYRIGLKKGCICFPAAHVV